MVTRPFQESVVEGYMACESFLVLWFVLPLSNHSVFLQFQALAIMLVVGCIHYHLNRVSFGVRDHQSVVTRR
jgi:hypothetical protein